MFRAILKLVQALVRNQLILKPRAAKAVRSVRALLARRGYSVRSIKAHLGLAEPSKLRITVIFPTDVTLERFLASPDRSDARRDALTMLMRANYPTAGVAFSVVQFHSHETIMRRGGYHYYFK
jgi:hypothetical protein